MGAADASAPRLVSDLTARARIRDAAIECFAADGFEAGFRAIATRAEVSPGLITHHFGSKAALREACDAEVLRRYLALKTGGMDAPSLRLFESFTNPDVAATTVYILQAVLAGGPTAAHFLEQLVDEARVVMTYALDIGLVRPSRDEEARVRFLAHQSLGALLVQFLTMPGATPEQFVASLHTGRADTVLPQLELYTEGLLTSRQLLDDYMDYLRTQAPDPS